MTLDEIRHEAPDGSDRRLVLADGPLDLRGVKVGTAFVLGHDPDGLRWAVHPSAVRAVEAVA